MCRKILGLGCAAVFLLISCDVFNVVDDNNSSGSVTLDDFRITNEISGWSEDASEGYTAFDVVSLYDMINGGAVKYVDDGLVEGFRQKMTSASGGAYQVMVMDFGSADKAKEFFDLNATEYSQNAASLDGFQQTTAFVYETDLTSEIYAHFEQYYFEIIVSGIANTANATREGKLFVGFYNQKVE